MTLLDFPSNEWVQAYQQAVNANERYVSVAKDWVHGSVSLVVEADQSLGIEEDLAMLDQIDDILLYFYSLEVLIKVIFFRNCFKGYWIRH